MSTKFNIHKDKGSLIGAVGYQTSGKKVSFHIELERTLSNSDVKENLGINAGMRWAF